MGNPSGFGRDLGAGSVLLKIALINVRYSPNLGDGLLSECLEAELGRHLPGASFVTVDLAGRTAYGGGSRWRGPLMTVLLLAPSGLRRILTRGALRRLVKRLTPQFAQTFADCHAAVLGGGNLLADADLNFPIKIAGALEAAGKARPRGMPTAVFAVGVSRNWSSEGAGLFRRVLSAPSLVFMSVRDRRSRDALAAQAPEVAGRGVAIVHDPGLLAARHFPAEPGGPAAPIGLCITDPLALRYHGGDAGSKVIQTWFGELAKVLAAQQHRVLLFTNGSPEDRAFLARHAQRWQAADPTRILVADAADTPAGLVRTIAGCSLVIAHRMHACIVAHSFAIPTIGLRWDPKLDAFFDTASRGAYVYSAGRTPPAVIAESVQEALAEGVDRKKHTALVAGAVDDVAALARKLREAVTE